MASPVKLPLELQMQSWNRYRRIRLSSRRQILSNRKTVNIRISITAASVAFLFQSCTMRPAIRGGNGEFVSLGGSFLSKGTQETASYKGPLGEVSYSQLTKDETAVANRLISVWGTAQVAQSLAKSAQSAEKTSRVAEQEATKREATRSAASVEETRILNPVEEIPTAIIPP